MMRAIIIDDEQKGINSLKLLIDKFTDDVKVVAETTDARKGIELIGDFEPELVFLDIKMPHLNGFELLQHLNFRDFSLIFTTAHDEFGIQAIRNNALDYLLKPIDAKDLQDAISKARERQQGKVQPPEFEKLFTELNMLSLAKIPFHTRDKVEYINRQDIIRLESDSNYTSVYITNGYRLMISKTIGDYEALLCSEDHTFMRVHQSHIVNLRHVSRYIKDNGGTIITSDNYSIPLSKNKKDDFTRWLNIK